MPPIPSDRRPSRRPSYWQRDALTGVAFVSPQLLGFAAFVVGPILAVVWFSLHDWNLISGTFEFVGLGNFERMGSDRNLGTVALATVLVVVGYVPVAVAGGLLLALVVEKATFAVAFFRTIYFAPVVISAVAWVLVWRFLLQQNGVINGFLQLGGLDGPNWLREPPTAIAMVVLVQALKDIGFSMVIFLAALQGVPPELKEAARIDGANRYALFRNITLPLISPFVFLSIVLSIIGAIKSFSLIFLLTRGGPGYSTTTLSFDIYLEGLQNFDMGYASSLAMVLFLVVLVVTAAQFAVRKRWVVYED